MIEILVTMEIQATLRQTWSAWVYYSYVEQLEGSGKSQYQFYGKKNNSGLKIVGDI